ncbi:MAG: HEAT repeat domain-containing protein [Pirellulales bacterium]
MNPRDYTPPAKPTIEQQHDALQKGLGRAVLWARSGVLAEESLRHACVNDLRFDRQCESYRGHWLWTILVTGDFVTRLRAPILDALRELSDDYVAYQLCQLAGHYAEQGDAEFRSELYRLVERKPLPDCRSLGEDEILRLDGEAAFLFAVRARGEHPSAEGWDWGDTQLVEEAIKRLGEPRTMTLLDDSDDTWVRRFATTWREQPQRNDGHDPMGDYRSRMRAISVDDLVRMTPKNPYSPYRGWGKHADEAQLTDLFDRICVEPDPTIAARLLKAMSWRALPTYDERLSELCRSSHPDVRRSAWTALSRIQDSRVRDDAIAELRKEPYDPNVFELFERNFRPGDEELLLKRLELPDDRDVRHWVLSDLRNVVEQNRSEYVAPLALTVYFETPCAICRGGAAEVLLEMNTAPTWLQEEYAHDSETIDSNDA